MGLLILTCARLIFHIITNESTNLHDIKQVLVLDFRKLDDVRRIHDTLQLDDMISYVLERSPAIHHHVEDTA